MLNCKQPIGKNESLLKMKNTQKSYLLLIYLIFVISFSYQESDWNNYLTICTHKSLQAKEVNELFHA